MKRFLVKVVITAVAFWLTTLIVDAFSDAPGISITPFAPGGTLEFILTLLLVALIFGLVNGIVGNFIRIVAFPLYILTLGLIALVVNSLLLLLVSWISGLLGFGLHIDGFWWGVLVAIILGIISVILGLFAKPLTAEKRRR
jgi:putative membrane protein